jgi:spore germination protein GerM
VLGTDIEDGTLTVDLSAEFESVSGEPRIQAVAQLVFTAMRVPGSVDGVLFTVDGEQITVPDADGADIDGPAVRGDYSTLVPR